MSRTWYAICVVSRVKVYFSSIRKLPHFSEHISTHARVQDSYFTSLLSCSVQEIQNGCEQNMLFGIKTC